MDDKHSFARAANRCVGAGVCRRHHDGVMCPSYQVTLEEKHSTRGRARMLFEMVRGDVVTDGWKSEEVRSALDLCLSCKGCKGDCPVQVDMATYKAEFLSHYYEGRARPRHAYAFGLIMYWAQLAAKMPGVVNLLTHLPVLSGVAKKMAGMAPERTIPAFAPMTFRGWFEGRARPKSADGEAGRPEVILWADTFNNHFHPAAAVAAVEVLETAGFKVIVPEQHLCCGRPLYDYGFLDLAERFLKTILEQMRPYITNDIPVVVLEPSCAAVFKDEMPNLLPDNEDARRLSDLVFMLSDFLEKKAPDFKYPRLERKALLHGHCHHKSLLGMKPELSVFQKMGLTVDQPDPGCCGMAGAFGFEEGDHYDVAVKVGNLALVPAVKEASADTLIIADGFSCREQIQQS
ncbi:MAG: (Fe-S)-binding protein, partial [Chloroflexi bacterium]|nr:(Fe-S)-binding protein [Chloroflexota bacterium]